MATLKITIDAINSLSESIFHRNGHGHNNPNMKEFERLRKKMNSVFAKITANRDVQESNSIYYCSELFGAFFTDYVMVIQNGKIEHIVPEKEAPQATNEGN